MKNTNKLIIGITILFVVIGILWYLNLIHSTKPIVPESKIKVKFGLTGTPDVLDIPYFIAKEKGFFSEEGLDIEFIMLNGDAIALQSLLANSVDVVSSGHFAVIKAINEGAEIKAFASIQNSHDYVLSASEKVKSIKDLEGKTIAIYSPGDITEIVTIGILRKYGINPEKVNWLSVGGSNERYLAVLTGKVDAAPLHADYGYKIEKEQGFHTLIAISKEQPLPMSVVSAEPEFLKENPAIAEKITRALMKATRHTTENKNDFIDVANKNIKGISKEELSEIYDFLIDQGVYGVNGGITKNSINNAVTLLVSIGELKKTLPADKIADFSFINKIINELGKK